MKKKLSIVLAVVMSVGFASAVSACGKKNKGPKTVTVTTAEEFYGALDKNITLAQDIVLHTADEGFIDGDRALEGQIIDGNGYTITIKGEEGKVANSTKGLFKDIQSSTVKNLKIVYDMNVNVSGTGDGYWFGGLAASATGSTIENCSVALSKHTEVAFWVNQYGYGDNGCGGLLGCADNTTIVNCQTDVNINFTGRFFGGIVGHLRSGSVAYCKSTVYLSAHNLEQSYIGGLVGAAEKSSQTYACEVAVQKMQIVSKPQGWRYKTAFIGMFVGSIDGSLHNCFGYHEDRTEGVVETNFSVEEKNSGLFITTIKWGYFTARTMSNAKLKNLYFKGPRSWRSNDGETVLVDSFVQDRSGLLENLYLVGLGDQNYPVVDGSGNEVSGFYFVYAVNAVEFPVTEIGEVDYWERKEDGDLVLKPYVAE